MPFLGFANSKLMHLQLCTMLGRALTRPVMASAAAGASVQCRHELASGGHLAYRITRPATQNGVGVIFLHGLLSTMTGTKATALEKHAQQQGHGYLCYDARGHGSSSGSFIDTNISHWYEDATTAMQLAPAKQHILVGSSFGGWQAVHLAANYPNKVAGLVLIAPALDITEQFWHKLTTEQQVTAKQTGRVGLGSRYVNGGEILVNMQFFEAGKQFCVLDKLQQLQVQCPVRVLHGVQDDVVPVATSQQLFEQLPASDMVLKLVKDGDHQLSRPQDIQLLLSTVQDLLQQVTPAAAGS